MTARVVANGDTVSLRYILRLRDGIEILSNFDDPAPLTLTLGDGTLAPTLEQWLIGITTGKRHVFLLEATQAFGASQPDLIHTLPASEVMTGKPLQIGSVIEFTQANGETLAGQILAIEDDTVRVDFNHPLADLPIEFEVEIIAFTESADTLSQPSPLAGEEVNVVPNAIDAMNKTILLANPRGFCAGVDRAIAIVERALEKFGAPIYVRHEVVHNTYVVNDLKNKGAIFVDELVNVPTGSTVIFSAHGVSQAVRREAEALGLHVFDATCPLVTKVHVEVTKMREKGLEIIMIGHRGHPEVEGTLGQSNGGMYLVETPEDVATLQVNSPDKLAYVTQTTLSMDDAARVVDALKQRFPSIVGPKKYDICYATQNRQDAVKAMAPQCDVVIVVGSPTSSNSNRLREVAHNLNVPAYMVDQADEIQPDWIAGKNRVGLTAGASAPEVLVEAVIARLKALGGGVVVDLEGIRETVGFPLPKGLT